MPHRVPARRRLTAALAGSVLTVAGLGVSVATASPAAANGTCDYHTTEAAQVRENPSINSDVRKTVPAGYHVTGPVAWNGCVSVTGTDGRQWVPVDCLCATDRIGYIIASKLGP